MRLAFKLQSEAPDRERRTRNATAVGVRRTSNRSSGSIARRTALVEGSPKIAKLSARTKAASSEGFSSRLSPQNASFPKLGTRAANKNYQFSFQKAAQIEFIRFDRYRSSKARFVIWWEYKLLRVNPKQIEALNDSAREKYANKLLRILRQKIPKAIENTSDSDIKKYIKQSIVFSEKNTIKNDQSVAKIATLCILTNCKILSDKDSLDFMQSASYSGDQKADMLFDIFVGNLRNSQRQ